MFATKICSRMLYLLLFCSTVLCYDGLSDMERELVRRNGPSTSTVRQTLKGCDLGSAETLENESGACVKQSLCQTEEEKGRSEATTVDPATSFIPRSLDSLPFDVEEIDNDNPKCNGYLEVCCKVTHILLEPKPKDAVKPTGCGFSNPGANIFRATPDLATYAEFADFPWMVALMKNDGGAASQYIGGGSIIHPSVVMTAAHKVSNSKPNQLICRAGDLNLTSSNEVYKHQERSVSRTIIHPEHIWVNEQYDVALLVLSSPFDLTSVPHIGVACLEPQLPRPGTICYSMGWGQDFDGKPQSQVLKKLTLPLVDQKRCENLLQKQLTSRFRLHDTLTCAGGEENVDTCIGDGGSSLVCPIGDGDKTRYSVVGMVAYGISEVCGKKDEPAVYVKVPAIYDWIVNEMSYLSLDSSTFVY